MDNKQIEEVIRTINESLKKYPDIKFDITSMKNDIYGFKLEVEGVELGKLKDLENKNLRLSLSYGFPQNIVGMEFQSSNKSGQLRTHRIVEFKTANRSYPIITTELSSGNSYKFSPSTVKTKLGGNNLINRNANIKKLFEDE
jgi:hypothetical protein